MSSIRMLKKIIENHDKASVVSTDKLFKNKVQTFSVSLVGRNLLYFAEKKDIDLNQYIGDGGSGLQTPSTRRYGLNLNVTF